MAIINWYDETINDGDQLRNTGSGSWVEMATRLKTISSADGEVDATTFKLNSTTVNATADELNLLHGKTSVMSDLVDDTTPQLGGNLDLNSHNINLTSSSGLILSLTADSSVSFSQYEIGMLSSTGMVKANATAESTSAGMIAMALESISTGGSGNFLLLGRITNSSWSFSKGDIIYIAETDGAITNTKPTTSGHIVRILGYALDSTEILFKPDNTYIENS